jgi:hypothetical protein
VGSYEASMSINTQHLFRAKQILNQFLHEHPEALEQQKKIEELLKNAGSSGNRMAFLSRMMNEKVRELGKELAELEAAMIKLMQVLK